LALLPGDWGQVDYHEDQSCYVDAMTLSEYHPVLASVSQSTFTSHVDGYMTTIPTGGQVLMERTKNQEGAFVYYEYGQGRMLVTNMYDDWGRTVGQSSADVRDLFRDVVRWSSIGDQELPDVRPAEPVEMMVDVTNVIVEDTAKLHWVAREPNGTEVDSGLAIQDQPLLSGQTVPMTVNFTPGNNSLGIWSLSYRLLDSDEQVMQSETQAAYFVISDPPPLNLALEPTLSVAPTSPGVTDAEVILTLDQEAYLPEEAVTTTLDITLSDPGSVSGLKVVLSLGETTLEEIVPALANQQVIFNLPAGFSGNGLLFYGVYESAAGQGLYLNTRWLQRRGDSVTVVPAAPNYAPGDTVTLDITGDYTRTLFVDAVDFARSIEVSGTITATFDLPDVLSSGPVEVHYQDGGYQRTARFDVVGPRVTVTSMRTNRPIIAPGGLADIMATIVADQPLDVLLTGRIVDGDGFFFPAVTFTDTLSVGEQIITMTMPISTTTSGSVRFEMTIADATKTAVKYVQAHRFLTIDAPVLQAVRAAGGQLATTDKPEVSLDWYAPAARSVGVILWLDGVLVSSESVNLASGFSTTKMTIPTGLAPGGYAIYARADLGDGLTTSASAILRVVESGIYYLYLPIVTR